MVSYFIQNSDIMLEVANQRDQNCSLCLATADMITMVMRMSLKNSYLTLSPQPLIDAFPDKLQRTPGNIQDFCTRLGLASLETYAFTRIPRDNFNESNYASSTYKRYKLHDLCYTEDKRYMKELIVQNFGPEGKKYPVVVTMYLGKFADRDFARSCEENMTPYCPLTSLEVEVEEEEEYEDDDDDEDDDEQDEDDDEQALLVIGCDTTSTDASKHYCRVQNSFGKKWGKDGFSIVAFEAFKCCMVPVFDNE